MILRALEVIEESKRTDASVICCALARTPAVAWKRLIEANVRDVVVREVG